MTDIMERLRDRNVRGNFELRDEATAEIERLREADKEWKIVCDSYADENGRFHAEIERLRTNEDAAIKYACAMDEVNDELRAEIERLRFVVLVELSAENERLQAIADTDTPELQQQHEEILQLRAENERLKADLKAITAARQAEQEVLAMEGKLLVRLVLDK